MPELDHVPGKGFGATLSDVNFSKLEHYELELGDCLIFGDLAVHRTFMPPGGMIERESLEFRLVRPDDALDIKDYFDIQAGGFVRTDGSTRGAP